MTRAYEISIALVCIFCLRFHYFCEELLVTSPCSDAQFCDNTTDVDLYLSTVASWTETTENASSEEISSFDVTALPQILHGANENTKLQPNKDKNIGKINSDVCTCDLTVQYCDINCCCDIDCNDFQLSIFSKCDQYFGKVYNSRYCYKHNFIVWNNTKFVHNKITDNLFCIAYDNLPPKFNSRDDVFNDINLMKSEINNIKKSINKWPLDADNMKPIKSINRHYEIGDPLWKLQGKSLKPLELFQTGFTSHCNLKKAITYLEDWKETCYQTELNNKNEQLFAKNYNNFALLSTPFYYKTVYNLDANQTCSRNVCVPLSTYYCSNSWDFCTTKESRPGFCTNQTCENIALHIKYRFLHNGTEGIVKASVYILLSNVSSAFYQEVDVGFQWMDVDKNVVFERSGNPGYIIGKPIIIGASEANAKPNAEPKYITTKDKRHDFTLSYAAENGECDGSTRYTIEFGKDAKTNCWVTLVTNNFTARSCQKIQNHILELMLRDLNFNFTDGNPNATFAAKFGNGFDGNATDWVEILFQRVPKNMATGGILRDELRCENMTTAMKINVLHSLITKPEGTNNHAIRGVLIEFSSGNTSWPKCRGGGCANVLKTRLQSAVTFYDVSKISKHNFVVGSSIDIRLPHDFFYPFVNGGNFIEPSVICFTLILIAFRIRRI